MRVGKWPRRHLDDATRQTPKSLSAAGAVRASQEVQMKIPVRLATLFAVTLMPVASFHASTVDARPTLSRPCPLTLPQQISTGTLSNGQTSTVIKWSLTCTGPFTASARGGKLILQSA